MNKGTARVGKELRLSTIRCTANPMPYPAWAMNTRHEMTSAGATGIPMRISRSHPASSSPTSTGDAPHGVRLTARLNIRRRRRIARKNSPAVNER